MINNNGSENPEKDSLQKGLMGDRSVLNVDAQKELIAFAIKANTRNAMKIIAIVLPAVLIFVGIILYMVFSFVGVR